MRGELIICDSCGRNHIKPAFVMVMEIPLNAYLIGQKNNEEFKGRSVKREFDLCEDCATKYWEEELDYRLGRNVKEVSE